ncbi:MAG: mevalonate kinase [Saprospiraceae bacterium]|nr:mevalonate kinase [Saprospiraceae bacterium]
MKTYSSKLLLFGEHIVIKGARALATPYAGFQGRWEWSPDDRSLQQSLPDFLRYVKAKSVLAEQLDHIAFEQDLEKGLYFAANIPTGYGLGSSGALCAAVYDRYAKQPIARSEMEAIPTLQETLARMESFFHQSSSGVDPLVCYMNQTLVLQKGEVPQLTRIRATSQEAPLFLVDTHQSRKTAPYVSHFLSRYENAEFRSTLEEQLLPTNEAAIKALLEVNAGALQEAFRQISQFQYEYFQKMIPTAIAPLWERGLTSKDFSLKLCGAGGGGFMLGLAKDANTLNRLQLGPAVL